MAFVRLDRSRSTHPPRAALAAALAAAAAVGLAACGSSSPATSGSAAGHTTSRGPTPSGTPPSPTVELTTVPGYGKVLVDAATGHTLYLLNSEKGDKVTCTSSNGCTTIWHPLVLPSGTSSPQGGTGLTASDLGTVSNGGATQVTYNGWPLYTFSGDTAAGQVKGEGINHFGGIWYVVDAAGNPVTSPTSSSSSSSSSGAYGSTSSSSGGAYGSTGSSAKSSGTNGGGSYY